MPFARGLGTVKGSENVQTCSNGPQITYLSIVEGPGSLWGNQNLTHLGPPLMPEMTPFQESLGLSGGQKWSQVTQKGLKSLI